MNQYVLYALVLAAGFAAGIINTLAGSGSLITLPALILLGLPPTVANGTNRIGVILQNLVAGTSFNRSKVLDLRGALLLSIPAVIGSVLGAQVAVNLNEEMMNRVIGAVMILMLFVIVLRPERWLQGKVLTLTTSVNWKQVIVLFGIGIVVLFAIGVYGVGIFLLAALVLSKSINWKQVVVLFVIGVYGGFIQAGVGIFLLAALVLSIGYDLVRGNAVKIVIILVFTLAALLVFARNSQVDWGAGLLLGVGNMAGAWVAARMAVKKGASWVRWVLIGTVALSAAYLFGLFDMLAKLF